MERGSVICSAADVARISAPVSSEPIRGSATPLTTTSSSRAESAATSDVLHSGSVKALQAITLASALEETARLVIKGLTAKFWTLCVFTKRALLALHVLLLFIPAWCSWTKVTVVRHCCNAQHSSNFKESKLGNHIRRLVGDHSR